MRGEPARNKNGALKLYLDLVAAIVCCLAPAFAGPAFSLDLKGTGDTNRVVVVDPGHGGTDLGTESPGGLPEKKINLELAQRLKEKLSGRYRVVLTRTADYEVPLAQRASIANNREGDLFISLHAGGGFRHSTDRWSIYFFRAESANGQGAGLVADRPAPVSWDHIQQRYAGSSALLAEKLRDRLWLSRISKRPEAMEAALAVLKGLDMPAVVVEYGYLTNPKTAAELEDESYMDVLAGALAEGVADFFGAGPAGD